MRLTSLKETGLSRGKKGELTGLQTCVKTLVDKNLKLVNVVQVMLIRLILRVNNGLPTCGSSIWRNIKL